MLNFKIFFFVFLNYALIFRALNFVFIHSVLVSYQGTISQITHRSSTKARLDINDGVELHAYAAFHTYDYDKYDFPQNTRRLSNIYSIELIEHASLQRR